MWPAWNSEIFHFQELRCCQSKCWREWINFTSACNVKVQWLFVCLFISTRAIFQLSGGCHHCRWRGCKFRPLLGAQGLWGGRDLYHATPTGTRDLGLYGLTRKTGTHVPKWDLNLRRKDHQIFAPNALTTAPRGRPSKFNEVEDLTR
jgi:hypothetical protein